ncbi:hypothetical protein BS50DRAFT_612957 [Corynespora cassiicola Philippines]|uniref:TPR-like protein n=1 Tax=Corynespora cassiicola Philippines TaxID=1448308 RepID=A0A2T2NBI0_CORCC|nr:hypothetical protein BS50DRAFT_612957 [Corynespora cassiicola Philippines]
MASAMSFGDANAGFQAGVVNGSVSTTHVYSPARLETPPRPSCVIPFRRDPDFVDRGTLLDQIYEKCRAPASRIALVGLGGVGKSQLAIEHGYRTAERWPERWVFWVHASNAARFEQGFRDIADRVKLAGRSDPQANIYKLVHDWLRDERKGSWALVLDNVDDVGFLLEPPDARRDGSTNISSEGIGSQPLKTYIPQCPNGSVLMTTRNRSAALQLVELHEVITVEPMDRADALALLRKKLGQQDSSEDIIRLADVLEHMPLAMVQAAAYVSQRRPRYSVEQYVADFQRSERKRTTLLHHGEADLRRDWEAKNSIIVTWQISFDYIRQTRPSAADLLALMSFYDRQGIPEALLRTRAEENISKQGQTEGTSDDDNDDDDDDDDDDECDECDNDEDNRSQSSAGDGFEDDMLMLYNFSFVSISSDDTIFEMHRLVQLATQKWLEVHSQLERWQQAFLRNLCVAFPNGEYGNWAACQRLFAHAKSAAAQRPEKHSLLMDWASILYKAAWYAWRLGKGVEAEAMARQAMKARKTTLGYDHRDTLESMAMIGLTLQDQGKYEAAEKMNRRVLEGREKALGKDHPDTLTSMNDLAGALQYQGKYEAAEKMNQRVLEGREKALGKDHPDTLTSVSNLALVLQHQGKYEVAKKMNQRAREGYKKALGKDHPYTLTSVNNLAGVLQDQRKYEAAEGSTRQPRR